MKKDDQAKKYDADGEARPDKAPDFNDFMNAAANRRKKKKHQKPPEKPAEEKPKEQPRRFYGLSSAQRNHLRAKYGKAVLSRSEIVIDGSYIFNSNPVITEFTRELWEMGILTPEEAELAAGKRPLPRERFVSDHKGADIGNIPSGSDDFIFESGLWIDLIYPKGEPPTISEYIAYHEKALSSLRVYNSNPRAALHIWDEYFAFDPSELRLCLAAVEKIRDIWDQIKPPPLEAIG